MALQFDSYLNNQEPQQNQYLTGNPSTDTSAQTSWMDDSGSDWNKTSATQQTAAPTPPQSGTLLGSIATGTAQNWGSAPLGFEQDKWNDPNAGTSLKYQVGRMAAQGMPIDQIAAKVGAKVIAPDKIQYPDGFIADIYFDYGGPNQRVQYTDVTPGNGQDISSFLNGGQNQQGGLLQWLMSMLGNNGQANGPSMGWAQPINRNTQPVQPNLSGPVNDAINRPAPQMGGFGQGQQIVDPNNPVNLMRSYLV